MFSLKANSLIYWTRMRNAIRTVFYTLDRVTEVMTFRSIPTSPLFSLLCDHGYVSPGLVISVLITGQRQVLPIYF